MFSEELGFLLRRGQTRLGVFSACNSGRWEFVEPLLRSGLRALVGTHGLVTTIGSAVFMQKLYSALVCSQTSIDGSIVRGLMTAHPLFWLWPFIAFHPSIEV